MSPPPPTHPARLNLLLHTHPFEVALGLALLVNGIRGFLGQFSPSVTELPALPLFMYLGVSVLGGLGTLIGLWRTDHPEGKIIERASLWLVAASYAGFALLVVAGNGAAGIATGSTTLIVAAACIFRARAIRKAQRLILEQLRAQNRPGGEA